jgi:TPR repeat protein
MQNAEELFNRSVQFHLRAERAVGEAKAGLRRQHADMLHRVVEVDPHHVKAQHNLGVMYEHGEGAEKDAVQAVRCYRKVAEQGLAAAQNGLGNMYSKGEGVEKDAAQAVHWYRTASFQRISLAQKILVVMSKKGEGVKKDTVQAVHWFRRYVQER